jgi:hypothetical protein
MHRIHHHETVVGGLKRKHDDNTVRVAVYFKGLMIWSMGDMLKLEGDTVLISYDDGDVQEFDKNTRDVMEYGIRASAVQFSLRQNLGIISLSNESSDTLRIAMYFSDIEHFVSGTIVGFSYESAKHQILFEDGDFFEKSMNEEIWFFLKDVTSGMNKHSEAIDELVDDKKLQLNLDMMMYEVMEEDDHMLDDVAISELKNVKRVLSWGD